jgi:flagellar assembly factor FliW
MKYAENIESEPPVVEDKTTLRMPLGLLGFERIKEYQLLANPEEAPFLWLQVPQDPALAFLLINPFVAATDYQPDIPEEDARFLDLQTPDDALLFNIVTLRGPSRATVNLKGPIILNRRTFVGKQVVLNNASEYSVQHPLPVAN